MDNLGEDHTTGYFKYTTNSMSEWSLYITPTSWHKCSLCQLFYRSRYTAGAPSAWAFRLDRDAGCTQCPIVHLPPAVEHQRWLQFHCTRQHFAVPAPAWKESQGTPAHSSWLVFQEVLPGLRNTRVVEEGKALCLPWQVILSSPLRQYHSVLLTQLKSLKQTPAPFSVNIATSDFSLELDLSQLG